MVVVYGIDLHLSIPRTMDDKFPVNPRIYGFVNDLEKLPPLVDWPENGENHAKTDKKWM